MVQRLERAWADGLLAMGSLVTAAPMIMKVLSHLGDNTLIS
jgi:hypothetical protein